MSPPTFVLADLHLTRHTRGEVIADLVHLIEVNPGARFVFAGDLLDMSAESPPSPRPRSLEAGFGAHPSFRAALGRHLDGGGAVWIVGGNHDAELGEAEAAPAIAAALGIASDARARLRTTPWFFREGGVHIEHGHFYDPDNAPAHPLVAGEPSLGVHFVEEFIAKTGAHAYLNANDDTPLRLFLSSFRWYGSRAPYVVYRFFRTAFSALARSGRLYRAHHERALGSARVAAFAEAAGVDERFITELIALGATPTLTSSRRTFFRLYLDRVAATVLTGVGAAALASGKSIAGGAALGAGTALMLTSWAHGHDRYGGTVPERLAAAAGVLAEASAARLVIFGHAHREALEGAYANTGSFSFPGRAPGRPYLRIEGDAAHPRAVRHHVTRASSR